MFSRTYTHRPIFIVLAIAILFAFALGGATVAGAAGDSGAVYTMTNAAGGNAVAVFSRAADGTLTPAGTVPTGGLGTGGGLGNQGGLILSQDHRWLFAVNAGSNEISVFQVRRDGLRLVDIASSGGELPISLTVHDELLYVLNAGGDGNITGFRFNAHGELSPVSNSTRPLSSAAPGPAQVAFRPDGRVLVVTEKDTNLIDTYTVGGDGRANGPMPQASSGQTPFGMAFDPRGRLFVSEAFGGAPDQSALSSYTVSNAGSLAVISASVGTTETAACWVVITGDGRYAYTTNTGSSSISGYRISRDGTLTLLDDDGRTAETGDGSSPIDAAVSSDSEFLYALTAGTNTIVAFQVGADGSLTPLPGISGLPAGANGLAAR